MISPACSLPGDAFRFERMVLTISMSSDFWPIIQGVKELSITIKKCLRYIPNQSIKKCHFASQFGRLWIHHLLISVFRAAMVGVHGGRIT